MRAIVAARLVNLVFMALLVSSQSALAGIIQFEFSGTNLSGLPESSAAPLSFVLEFNTDAQVLDSNPAERTASFVSAWQTALPPGAPEDENEVIRSVFPELVLSTRVTALGGNSNPSANQLRIGPNRVPTEFSLGLVDGAAADSIAIRLSSPGFFPPSTSWSLALSVTSDVLFDASEPLGLTSLDALAGRDFLITGTGQAAEGRASPLNAWSLSVDTMFVTNVTEPGLLWLALIGILGSSARRGLTTQHKSFILKIAYDSVNVKQGKEGGDNG